MQTSFFYIQTPMTSLLDKSDANQMYAQSNLEVSKQP